MYFAGFLPFALVVHKLLRRAMASQLHHKNIVINNIDMVTTKWKLR
jgi:hypothetical protein